jgi:hypothetical protein
MFEFTELLIHLLFNFIILVILKFLYSLNVFVSIDVFFFTVVYLSYYGVLVFEEDLLPRCLTVSTLGFAHLGSFFVRAFNLICVFSWEFLELGSDWVMVYFLVSKLMSCGSVVTHLASVPKMLGATLFSMKER